LLFSELRVFDSSITLKDIVSDLVDLFDTDVYVINHRRQVLYTNRSPGVSGDSIKSDPEQPCYKVIFNQDVPCSYCGFTFTDNKDDQKAQSALPKRTIRIKNHLGREVAFRDFSLTQKVLYHNDEGIYVDILNVSQGESIYNAGDQLITLGAHVQTVAHELSNPITGLNLTRQQIVKILDSKEVVQTGELRPLVDLLLKDIRRAAGVLSEIRNYSRPVNKAYKLVDLKSVLKSALDNVVRVYQSDNIRVVFQWNAGESFTIAGNSAKLEQCFINILKNSFEMFSLRANPQMGDGVPEVSVIVEKTDKPGFVKIQIIDNAGGISNEALTKVFKPYFTTKESFRGLGLGLYIAGKILKEHHSTISIESVGEKTMVTIYMKQEEAPNTSC